MPKALMQGRIAVQFTDLLRKNLDNKWSILVWDPKINTPEEFVPMAREADVIIGGGDTAGFVNQYPNTLSHISTGGGASIHYLGN